MSSHADRLPLDHPLLRLLHRHPRVLLAGPPGTGKTTLARAAARRLTEAGVICHGLSLDPGLPGFGPPGAVCRGCWREGDWHLEAMMPLATLDAARFRLPLVEAARRLADALPAAPVPVIIDAPGLVRGMAAAELLPALIAACRVEALLMLAPEDRPPPLDAECRALGLTTHYLAPAPGARSPGRQQRTQQRTAAWERWLDGAVERRLERAGLAVVGSPPPDTAPDDWRGRQVGLFDARGAPLGLGEVLALESEHLVLRVAARGAAPATLLIRDARRRDDGRLGTARPHRVPPSRPVDTADAVLAPREAWQGPPPQVRLAAVTATLVNGGFGDPLLQLRLAHHKRSLLFDLGDPGRLPARLAHQVSDVFISHAHFDHIGGFPWLLRSRIGDFPPCRFHGPPGLAGHLAGLVNGVLWDRVGDKAPRFEVSELHGERLVRHRLTAGQAPVALPSRPAPDGVLHAELGFRVRAVTLDHGTPVLAFAFEPERQVKVRKERLNRHGWPPGPWLGELKARVLAGDEEAYLTLPDGARHRVSQLARTLLLTAPGERLVYATDLGDTAENRRRLIALARGARVLFCEAPFLHQEAEQARTTGHLTALACGEIAAAAGVEQLIPFHFSRRHVGQADAIHAEIHTRFSPPEPAHHTAPD